MVPQDSNPKTCSRCGETKDRSSFSVSRAEPDGLCYWCKSCKSASKKDWASRNRKHLREYQSNYLAITDYNKRWRRSNPDKRRAIQRTRDERLRERRPIDRESIRERDKSTCYLCGGRISDEDFSIDHVIPISRGGSSDPDNVRSTHKACNAKKARYLLEEIESYGITFPLHE